MITSSAETDLLDQALAKVLSEVSGLERSATNPFTKSKYPNLEDVWKVLRSALRNHGVSVTQHPFAAGQGLIGLESRVALKGQWLKSELVMPIQKWDPQGWGAGLTYAKRYALSAIFGLAEDDDDGNTASGRALDAQSHRVSAQSAPAGKGQLKKPQKREDWENAGRAAAAAADGPNELDQALGEPEPFLTEAAAFPKNDAHGSYVIRFGQNAGKRIDQVGDQGLIKFMRFCDDQKAQAKTLAPLVLEAFEHATGYMNQ